MYSNERKVVSSCYFLPEMSKLTSLNAEMSKPKFTSSVCVWKRVCSLSCFYSTLWTFHLCCTSTVELSGAIEERAVEELRQLQLSLQGEVDGFLVEHRVSHSLQVPLLSTQ